MSRDGPPGAFQSLPETVRQSVSEALRACAEAARGALSESTERARRADLTVYAAWCARRGLQALPACAETLAAFIDAAAQARAPATVRRYVASIAAAHRAIGHARVARSAAVRLALKRMHRQRGRRQAQVRGLTWPLRQRLLDAAGARLIDDRNRALVAVAYDALLRRSELTAMEVADFMEEIDGSGALLVRRSKTDPEGRGAMVYLAPDTVALLHRWLARAGVRAGRLFRSVGKDGAVGRSLDPSQVPRIFKAMARRAGLPPEVAEALSGHSARVGAAQDMVAGGIGLAAILQAGRWKSTTMVNRYGEHLLARRSGAAQLARLQRRSPDPLAQTPASEGAREARDNGVAPASQSAESAEPARDYRERYRPAGAPEGSPADENEAALNAPE